MVLVVNTASQCGFTGQYKGLQELQDSYADQGLVVLGFPCDQFGNQEPGDEAEISDFCERNYGVTFPLFSKVDVNGDDAHPLFEWLKDAKGGLLGSKIKWNFTKFLVGRDGQVIDRYAPHDEARGPHQGHREGAVTRAGVLVAAVSRRGGGVGASSGSEWRRDGRFTTSSDPRVRRLPTPSSAPAPRRRARRRGRAGRRQGRRHPLRCGPDPVTITLEADREGRQHLARVVLDGDGTVTLSGGGVRRILYMNTCDRAQVWTTSHCNDQAEPRLVAEADALRPRQRTGETTDGGGGGAIFVRGGRLKIVDSTFADNRCDRTGPDVGGGSRPSARPAPRPPRRRTPLHLHRRPVQQRLGAEQHRRLVARHRVDVHRQPRDRARRQPCATRARPGGGSGGAIYLDGDDIHLTVEDSTITGNRAREGGGAIFFVSNDRTGTLTIDGSRLIDNPSDGFETIPGIFFLGASRTITDSVVR